MVTGAVAYLLRRWRIVPPILTAAVSLGLGLFLIAIPADRPLELFGQDISLQAPIVLLGRELVLNQSDRLAMSFLFFTGAVLFLLAWRFERGDLYAPLGMGILGLLSGVLLVRPLVYAALLLQISAALAVLPLHAEEESSGRGGMRYLTFSTLALPGLLVSHWLLDMYAVSPDQTGLLLTASALIGLSFALLLGLFPFHAWVPAVGSDGSPLMVAFLFSATTGTVWFLLLDYLQTYPWLVAEGQWSSLLSTIGIATAIVGGLLGATRRSLGSLIGYAMMVDTGLAVMALGIGTLRGIGLMIGILFARTLGVIVIAAGMGGLKDRNGEGATLSEGLGRQAPWSAAAVLAGGLSIGGFPLSLGFAMRWALVSEILRSDPATGLTILIISIGPLLGLLQITARLFRRPPKPIPIEEPEEPEEEIPSEPEPVANAVLLLGLGLAVLLLGLFPQPIALAAERLASLILAVSP
jgi:formate hydrogenlyase subunit 3/multisubunit Na+/H+ antiporter MnhD subunit